MQAYDLPRFRLVHADLYRLSGPAELAELGFEDEADGTVTLLEWPDRAAGYLPPDRLDIAFTLSPQQGEIFRRARVTGYGTLRRARRAHHRHPPLPRRARLRPGGAPLHAGRRLHARLRAADAERAQATS